MLLSKIGGKLKIIEICIGLFGIISFIWSYIAKLTPANYILFSIPICLFLLFYYLHSRLKRKMKMLLLMKVKRKNRKSNCFIKDSYLFDVSSFSAFNILYYCYLTLRL